MTLCIDASAVLSWLVPQQSSPAVSRFWVDTLEGGDRLVAPPLVFAETTSVLRRYVHRGVILHEEAVAALRELLELPLSSVHDRGIYLRALEFAHRLGEPKAYDVQYLAVAELQDCPVVTLDRGLYKSARALGIAAHLLA